VASLFPDGLEKAFQLRDLHYIALDFELSSHKRLLAIKLAHSQIDKVVLRNRHNDVRLAILLQLPHCFLLAERQIGLQVSNPALYLTIAEFHLKLKYGVELLQQHLTFFK